MTIREHKKNVMIVRDIDSDLISEAFFILKNDIYENESEEKISEEAERILEECDARAKKTRRVLPAALLGFLTGTGICAFLVSLLMLCIQFST